MKTKRIQAALFFVVLLAVTVLPLTAYADRELVQNGNFRGMQGWSAEEWFKGSNGKGEIIPEGDGIKFRSMSGNNRVGVMQNLNVDVSHARSLILTARVSAISQKLDGTGWQGREAPVAVYVAYVDAAGVTRNGLPSMANPPEPQGSRAFWQGFYYMDPTGNSRNWNGTKVSRGQFYTYTFDLMTLNPKPRTILFVGAQGAGWAPREGKINALSLRLVEGGHPPPPPPPPHQPMNLNGAWNCNDGGRYYIRQLGNRVWWYGEQSPTGPAWSNVATGTLNGNNLNLEWSDVPKGRILQSGTLHLRVENNNRISTINKTGGFGGSLWTR